MISRRSFLKLSGLAAAALSAGYGAGKLVNSGKEEFFTVYGFIPADESLVKSLVSSFQCKVNSGTPVILAEENWRKTISQALPYASSSGNNTTISLIKLNENISSDILICDNTSKIFNPETDFNRMFTEIRSKIKNRKAEYIFTAEYREKDFISRVFNTKEKVVVIENEKGIAERINLNNSYKNIIVHGPQGKTGVAIENGLVHIHTASCRHRICKRSGFISDPGKLIACAPNKVLL
ncbi:MAG: NusG domain II-containing protein, partial [Ignavibacteria bacterium]